MAKEKSCGAVVYKIDNGIIYFLIEKMKKGHFSLPKGHVENNETEIETALRETLEETGIKARVVGDFRKVITYKPRKNAIKDVVYFISVTAAFIFLTERSLEKRRWS